MVDVINAIKLKFSSYLSRYQEMCVHHQVIESAINIQTVLVVYPRRKLISDHLSLPNQLMFFLVKEVFIRIINLEFLI